MSEELTREIFLLTKIIEQTAHVERCFFNAGADGGTECDYCDNPLGAIFSTNGSHRDSFSFVCSKCLPDFIKNNLRQMAHEEKLFELEKLRAENAELRTKLGGEWIPVDDERKPRLDQVVWISYSLGNMHYVDRTLYVDRFASYVIAWMPFYQPEPYKP